MSQDTKSDRTDSDTPAPANGVAFPSLDELVSAASFIADLRRRKFYLGIDPQSNRPRVHPLDRLTKSQKDRLRDTRVAVEEVLRRELAGEWAVDTPWDVRWKIE